MRPVLSPRKKVRKRNRKEIDRTKTRFQPTVEDIAEERAIEASIEENAIQASIDAAEERIIEENAIQASIDAAEERIIEASIEEDAIQASIDAKMEGEEPEDIGAPLPSDPESKKPEPETD